MISVLSTEGRVQGLLLVSRPARRRRHLRRQRPGPARDLRPARRDLPGPRPAGDRPAPGHRAAGGAPARGDARPADRAAQPHAVPRPHPARPAPGRPQRPVAGRPLHRPRRVQAGQRHLRPPGRRPAAQGLRRSGCTTACGRPTPPPASAATSSPSCCTARSTPRACRPRSTASAPSSPATSTWAAAGRRRSARASAWPSPAPTPTSTALIRRADLAMYTAKRNGRGISVFYDPTLEAGGSHGHHPGRRPRREAALPACPHALPTDGSMPHGCALAAGPTPR